MRWIVPIILLAACSPEAEPVAERSLYVGDGRDRLCIDGDRAGFIANGAGDGNCSARGRLERTGDRRALVPAGDEDCRIEFQAAEGRIRLGPLQPACTYYCGPGADYSGREFRKSEGSTRDARDFAGDPLC